MTIEPTSKRLVAFLNDLEGLNFLLTNRIPRQALTRAIGWFSKIENPLICRLSIAVWRFFSDLDLSEAKQMRFKSMHDCFTRELKEGARPIDDDGRVLVSPCDAIVGACGRIDGAMALQAKGMTYKVSDLLHDPELVDLYRDGFFVTLRLTSSMYHRFHAPYDCRVERVTYVSGEVWNVNPAALKRVPNLFCRNERAIVKTRLRGGGQTITLVPVAAVLVASIRFHFLDVLLHLKYRGPNVIPCAADFKKGQEMGWFQHGSTIIVFAPRNFSPTEYVASGKTIRMGQPLFYL